MIIDFAYILHVILFTMIIYGVHVCMCVYILVTTTNLNLHVPRCERAKQARHVLHPSDLRILPA